jgi:hypothetical protein
LLEPDHIIYDVTTIEEYDKLRIVPRIKLPEIMIKQEELRRKAIYLKILYANDPKDIKTAPLDLLKGAVDRQKLGEEYTAKKSSSIANLKTDITENPSILDNSQVSNLSQYCSSNSIQEDFTNEVVTFPKKWERIDRANILEENKVMTPGMEDIYRCIKGVKDRDELIKVLKTVTLSKSFKVFLPHSETVNKKGEAKT